ncbi:MAG: hypothetical protein GVY27_04820 [Deinococcus-Thermus bacterium]|jgi:hypothetical protein|nr:hypothetical protein [Deinococcota bacterium]
MRILISLAAALAILAGVVMGIVMAGAVIGKGAQAAVAQTPVTTSTVSKVAFVVLWLLVAGVSAGLIGGA